MIVRGSSGLTTGKIALAASLPGPCTTSQDPIPGRSSGRFPSKHSFAGERLRVRELTQLRGRQFESAAARRAQAKGDRRKFKPGKVIGTRINFAQHCFQADENSRVAMMLLNCLPWQWDVRITREFSGGPGQQRRTSSEGLEP